jgi:hypothetical protein
MQARRAAVGCAGVKNVGLRKQDKVLFGELAGSKSIRDPLPKSFTTHSLPEDKRPVISQNEETIEVPEIQITHS